MKSERKFVLKIALSVFMLFCVLMIVQMQFILNDLKAEKAELELLLKEKTLEKQEKENELGMTFEEYVRKVAPYRIDYYDPNAIPFYNDTKD